MVYSPSDLVLVFQAGEYDDAVVGNSTWADGDWNCDGEFSSSDIVLAFMRGTYRTPPPAAAMVATGATTRQTALMP